MNEYTTYLIVWKTSRSAHHLQDIWDVNSSSQELSFYEGEWIPGRQSGALSLALGVLGLTSKQTGETVSFLGFSWRK